MTASHPESEPGRPLSADDTQPVPTPTRGYSAGAVHWPAPPQDAVVQDAPSAPVVAAAVGPAAASPRWSGRRTAAVAALALALTSAGALAAAAASPRGIAGSTEQRVGPGGGPGGGQGFQNRQLGPGGPGQQGQAGQPGTGLPGQGRGHH